MGTLRERQRLGYARRSRCFRCGWVFEHNEIMTDRCPYCGTTYSRPKRVIYPITTLRQVIALFGVAGAHHLLLARQALEPALRKLYSDQPGGPVVIAFLFAHPGSDAIRMLDARGEYFDVRTGDTWHLFYPGYYRSTMGHDFEQGAGGRPIGRQYAADWYFSPKDFNELRRHVEQSSNQLWEYSGGTDLVLVNGWVPMRGEPTIDWASISGQITDQEEGTKTLTLANVIERISRDLENAIEDASYGVREVTDGPPSPVSHIGRDFMIQALSGIAAALGAKALGG